MNTPRAPKPLIPYDLFTQLDLRIARILECRDHPNADKLLLLTINLGTEHRQICAPLKNHYTPDALIGKLVVVIANLAPRSMRGQPSQGMLLTAADPITQRTLLISPPDDALPGAIVS